MRFVVTGSGRCGTKYMAELLTAAGVPCGHELAYGLKPDWGGRVADSSWMASCALPIPEPVVRSWVEIGMFSWQVVSEYNPCHDLLRPVAPWVYEYPAECDRALAQWVATNEAALAHAEVLLRLETFDAGQFARLLAWSGNGGDASAFDRAPPTNRHEDLRQRTGIDYMPAWKLHDPDLAERARTLATLLGYEID